MVARIAFFIIAAAGISFAGKSHAGMPMELFADHPSAATGADVLGRAGVDPTVARERPVMINIQPLTAMADRTAVGSAAQTISLSLFPDVRHDFIPEKTERSRDGKFRILTGSIAGGRPLMNNATFVFGDGVVAGNIRPGWGSMIYQIRVSPSGIHSVREVDTDKFPMEGDPIPVAPPAVPSAGVPFSSDGGADAPVAAGDDGTTISVMVVYTASARSAEGGTTAMNALINLGVSETNQGYANSGVTQRITLAHSAEVTYTETAGSTGFSQALSDVTGTTDVYMDDVHTLRDTYAADMVSLWINNSAYCGIAYLMTTASASFASSAFSVVHHACATGYYSFGHEMGHNQGSHHDVYVAPENGVYSYSHGYVDTVNLFRTVMAYSNKCSDLSLNCTRINYWSNPNVTYTGAVTGDTSANNTLSLNNTVSVAANWRSSGSAATAPTATTGSASGVTTTGATLSGTVNPNNGSTTVKFQYGTSASYGSNTISETLTAGTTAQAVSATLTGLTCGTTYHFRVWASNSGGTAKGSDATFDTSTCTTPIVTTGAVTNKTQTGVTFNGTVNPNGLSTTWKFQYGTTTSYGSSTTSETLTAGTTAQAVSATLTTLTCGTTYHYRVWASNSSGKAKGSDVAFMTPACNAPVVTTDQATNKTTTGATLNGTVNPKKGTTTVKFQYGTTSAYGSNTPSVTLTADNTSQTVSATLTTELTCGTKYYFRVWAKNTSGITRGSNRTFRTLACADTR